MNDGYRIITDDNKFGFMGVFLIVGFVAGIILTLATAETKKPCIENYTNGWVGREHQLELDDNDKTDAEKLWHDMVIKDVIPRIGSVVVSPTGQQLLVPEECYAETDGNQVTLWSKK